MGTQGDALSPILCWGAARARTGCSGGAQKARAGLAAFTSRSLSGKKLVSTSGFFPSFLFLVVISERKVSLLSASHHPAGRAFTWHAFNPVPSLAL